VSVDSLTIRTRGHVILDAVRLTASDEVLGVAGPNGSGKTTLLSTIESAAWRRVPGVTLGANTAGARPEVGLLPQRFRLPKALSVREFIEYAAWLKRVPSPRTRAEGAMRDTHLTEFADVKLGRVSGGVAQRAGFAAVLVSSPDVLLLDEPTTAVDIGQRAAMREIIAEQRPGRVTIMSSHLAEDLEALCDRVLVLGQGKVRFLGTIGEAIATSGTSNLSEALLALSGNAR
jgi:ABC-2 type transport system ATP-binding protein